MAPAPGRVMTPAAHAVTALADLDTFVTAPRTQRRSGMISAGGLFAVALGWFLAGPTLAHRNPALDEFWAQQEAQAQAGQDAAIHAKRQCGAQYSTMGGIQMCEASQDRWYRYWHERYRDAHRQAERPH